MLASTEPLLHRGRGWERGGGGGEGGRGIHHIVNLSPFSYQVQAASSTESSAFMVLCMGCYGRPGGGGGGGGVALI